ncbi:CIR protein PIR protein [Plasmodium vinckei brucechwatti]|uniref:CIR protein PIR protein n=1 Tax=Plasmodium vinckei brucechwatti TaxID=119398 RepID=A0A6V7SDX2_PLAVN|nr:CIR protein PIR protein [Plasmodium vinckei brucechwatti]
MAKYNIENVYKAIITINDYFFENKQGQLIVPNNNRSIHDYCHYGSNTGKGNCSGYFEMAGSGVIHLIKKLKDTHNLEYEQLAEYAILWLSYKLNIYTKNNTPKLNDFYTKYIETNKHYNEKINGDGPTYKAIIDKKKNLMYTNDVYYLNHPFSLLCNLYKMINEGYTYCNFYLGYANLFADSFKKRNEHSNNKEGSLYNKILSTLSDDYTNVKNIYHSKKCTSFPSIPEIKHKKRPVENSVKGSLESSANGSEQILGYTPEGTSSNSSISTTLIPGLSVVSVIPVFLGIAYKYSLFGVDKLFQRQYIKNKLKKVKKKMKLNI